MSDTKTSPKVVKSEADWRQELTPMQYAVLREKATERPFSGEYEHEHRQGPDTGTQYRSAIFTSNDEQKKVAEAYIAQLNAAKVYKKPIVTKVGPLQAFYAAEDYHQDYLTLHPNQPYIAFNDIPKVENLKKIFSGNYIEKPTLVSTAKATN